MKIEMNRDSLLILPESVAEEIYIEEVLGLKMEGNTCSVIRRDTKRCIANMIVELKKETKPIIVGDGGHIEITGSPDIKFVPFCRETVYE